MAVALKRSKVGPTAVGLSAMTARVLWIPTIVALRLGTYASFEVADFKSRLSAMLCVADRENLLKLRFKPCLASSFLGEPVCPSTSLTISWTVFAMQSSLCGLHCSAFQFASTVSKQEPVQPFDAKFCKKRDRVKQLVDYCRSAQQCECASASVATRGSVAAGKLVTERSCLKQVRSNRVPTANPVRSRSSRIASAGLFLSSALLVAACQKRRAEFDICLHKESVSES